MTTDTSTIPHDPGLPASLGVSSRVLRDLVMVAALAVVSLLAGFTMNHFSVASFPLSSSEPGPAFRS